MILVKEGCVFRKECIGFTSSSTYQKPTKFVKGPTLHIPPKS